MYGSATMQNPFGEGKSIGSLLWTVTSRPLISTYFKTTYFPEYLVKVREILAFANDRAAIVGAPFIDGMREEFKAIAAAS